MKEIPPGDDAFPAPDPLSPTEEPPYDRFCDLVMTGGVASGVVYPWAVVELARQYRFRSIGGTSVGAMAAALAAAAEYGRRNSHLAAFEVLRRMPAALGEDVGDGRTRMLSLFQPGQHGQRLIKLWGQIFNGGPDDDQAPPPGGKPYALDKILPRLWHHRWKVARAFQADIVGGLTLGGWAGYGLGILLDCKFHLSSRHGLLIAGALLGAVLGPVWALWQDISRGIIDNDFGLCKGATLERPNKQGEDRPALTEWLHNGIQASAGLGAHDRPLTFGDLWSAPMRPGEAGVHCKASDPAEQRSIDLQMITTSTTHGRPYRLPLINDPTRLFFRCDEWDQYFPPQVMAHLKKVSKRYQPAGKHDPVTIDDHACYYELPDAEMPLVVAARLSLSYPALLAAVPLWAIDYTQPNGQRQLARCLFTDGGLSSNFPIHLFDEAVPRWPTFGLWLDERERKKYQYNPQTMQTSPVPGPLMQGQYVWLPGDISKGWGDWRDTFNDKRPGAQAGTPPTPSGGGTTRSNTRSTSSSISSCGERLFGFAAALLAGAKDWHDRAAMRMPHVRTRVVRLMLLPPEQGLNIGMPRQQILRMAYRYGTTAAKTLIERFVNEDGTPSAAWDEHRWVRLVLLVNTLREALGNLTESADWAAYTTPLRQAIDDAQWIPPLPAMGRRNRTVTPTEAAALQSLLTRLEKLAAELQLTPTFEPNLRPTPELRMRAPL